MGNSHSLPSLVVRQPGSSWVCGEELQEVRQLSRASPQVFKHHSWPFSPGLVLCPRAGPAGPTAQQHVPHRCTHTRTHTHTHVHTCSQAHTSACTHVCTHRVCSRRGIFINCFSHFSTTQQIQVLLVPVFSSFLSGAFRSGPSHWDDKHWRLRRESERTHCVVLTSPDAFQTHTPDSSTAAQGSPSAEPAGHSVSAKVSC